MPPTTLTKSTLLLLAIACLAQTSAPSVDSLLTDLSDTRFDIREHASTALLHLPASQSLRDKLTHFAATAEPEAAARATQILEYWNWGFRPETPDKILDLCRAYRTAAPQARDAILKNFMPAAIDSGDERMLLYALNINKINTVDSPYEGTFAGFVRGRVTQLLLANQFDQAEALLERMALLGTPHSLMLDYAALVSLRNSTDQAEKSWQSRLGKIPGQGDDIDTVLFDLASLRPGPDIPSSLNRLHELAASVISFSLFGDDITLQFRTADWPKLSHSHPTLHGVPDTRINLPILAAWLANDLPTLQRLVQESDNWKGDTQDSLSLALLFTGNREAALHGRPNLSAAVQLLAATGQWDRAKKFLAEQKPSRDTARAQLIAGKLLWQHNEHEAARTLWAQALATKENGVPVIPDYQLSRIYQQVGLNTEANALILAGLPTIERDGANGGCYIDSIEWWRILGQLQPKLSDKDRLAQAQAIPLGKLPWDQFKPLVDFVFTAVQKDDKVFGHPLTDTLLEACDILERMGKPEEARIRLETLAQSTPHPYVLERLARLAAKSGNWNDSARWWEKLANDVDDPANSLHWCQYALALEKSTLPESIKSPEILAKASLFALGNSGNHWMLARTLLAAEKKEDALREARLALRLVDLNETLDPFQFVTWYFGRDIANIFTQCGDPAAALIAWRIAAFSLTQNTLSYEDYALTLQHIAETHEATAKLLDTLHRPEEAQRERAAAAALNP